jgi:hypothetical protein
MLPLTTSAAVISAAFHDSEPQRMRLVAILEVPETWEAELPADLLRAAYQASQRGPVAVLMPPSADGAVNRELDPLVAADRGVHGVRYGRVSDASLWAAASSTTVVVASSADARQRAQVVGAGCLDAERGLEALRGLCADVSGHHYAGNASHARA